MVRINLLPPEIIQRRGFERNTKLVALGGVVLIALLVAVYAIMGMRLSQKNAVLQDLQQEEANLRAQAEAFKIFEEKESELEERLKVAERALARRVAWGRLANELSLVMPPDIWVAPLSCHEEEGITMLARAVDSPTDVPDVGHKAVARTLVRLADLEQITSVWLNSSVKTEYEEQPVIDFTVTTAVVRPEPPENESGVPAPPPPGTGQ